MTVILKYKNTLLFGFSDIDKPLHLGCKQVLCLFNVVTPGPVIRSRHSMLAASALWLILSVSENPSLLCILFRVTKPAGNMVTAQAARHTRSNSGFHLPALSRRLVLHGRMNE